MASLVLACVLSQYSMGTPGEAEVEVRDNDLPAVTITADRTPITEGETASFTVSVSTPAPEGGLVVNVALSEEGEFTGTLPEIREVTVPAGRRTEGVSVPTIDDGVEEPDGKIVARVLEHATAYTVGAPGKAEVVVRDNDHDLNDLPEVTITADRTPITEGEAASFTVSVSTPAPEGGLAVDVALSEEGEFTDTLPETREVTVPAGRRTQGVSVSTIDDGVVEPGGKIVARVVEHATDYAVGAPGEAEVAVHDNDLPVVTIAADRTPVTEGETASFTVSVSTPAPEGGLAVDVALSEEGEFTDTLPETREVTVPAGRRTQGVSVSTIDDGTDEPEGKIVARVAEHATDYTVGTPGEAEVVVRDNDLPEVTITADRTPITEGGTASFTVSVSTPAPEGGLAVDVALSEEGEFTGTLPETRAVTVPAGQRTKGVSVPTIDDGVEEPGGKIVARVLEHATDYAVGTPGEAEVEVRDNDLPMVTIAADRTPVTEGGTASFTVSVAGAVEGDLLVIPVELEQVGEFARDPLPKTHYVIWAYGRPPQTVSVPTIDDGTDEPKGKIVARVLERDTDNTTDYAVGAPGEAEVEVRDNDLPAVTITADRTPITEGGAASFTVSVSTPAPEGGLAVDVALSEEGEFTGTLPETREVTVPAGRRTQGVSVSTIDDGVVEPEGKIVARVLEHASEYTVGTPGEAEVAVHDSDNRPPEFDEGDESIRYVGEEAAVGTQFGAPVSATDEDADTLTYTLEGRDAENFAIDAGTGQLRTGTSLEFETKSVHEVVVSASDGRGGSDRIEVEVRVLNTLVTVPEPPAVERRLRVTANRASIDEGAAVTFTFASHEAAPAGGLKVYYSLKQLAVDDDANAYDFRPLPGLSTHHWAYVTIPAGERSASARFQTESDEIEETDVLLVVDIGIDRVSNFDGESCHVEGDSDSTTLGDRPAGCWASVDVLDQGGAVDRPEPIPFARYASVFPGHVPTFTGQNYQYINAGDSVRLTISLSIPAPRGGLEIFYSLYETASDFIGDVPIYPNIDRRSVTIPEYESEVFLTIPTRRTDTETEDCENQGREGAGCISASILTPPYAVTPGGQTYLPYLHAPSALQYEVTTIVRPAPDVLPTVTIAADRTPVTEGETASFTVSVAGAVEGVLLVIPVELEQVGEFARDPLPKTQTVIWAYGQPPQTVSVPTIDDGVVEPDGKIVARVGEHDTNYTTAYAVGAPGVAEVVVRDNDDDLNDLPAVTITADRTPITEGETASFTVSVSTPAPEGGLVVNVVLSEEGEFTDTLPEIREVTVPAGRRTEGVSVPTIDDGVDEPEGKIVARVLEHATAYTVGAPGKAEVVVRDNDDDPNDLPEVTITADRTPITEGETASFTVSVSTPAPEGGLAVDVALSEEGEFTGTLPETRAVTVPAGRRTEGVSVPTIDDGVEEPDGKIVARVLGHDTDSTTDYAVGAPGEAEVVVRDNDHDPNDLPEVTITADRTPITEGETASFTVSVSTPAPEGGLAVDVALSEEGEFTGTLPETRAVTVPGGQPEIREVTVPGGQPEIREVTVPAGRRTEGVSVPTIDDGVEEPDGKIVARVLGHDTDSTTDYAVGAPGEAEVVVRDNDHDPNDLPEVTITADRTPITEGEAASFTVSVSAPAPEGGLAVNVALSEEGEFTGTLPETRAVTVPAGQRTEGVSVPTIDDGVDEPEGKIVARVLGHDTDSTTDYAVGAPGEAEVVVRDNDHDPNDLPEVTITADRTPITEGEAASFTVSVSTPAPEGGLAVNVALSEEGEFTGTLPETRAVTVPAGQRTEGVSVPTIDDGVEEPDGKIVARVLGHDTDSTTDYAVGAPGEAEVVVRDNDDDDDHDPNDLPEVTITADRTPITEGEAASFTVSVSTPAPEGGLAVNVVLSEEGEFTDTLPEIREVKVPAGRRTQGVSVPTIDDGVEEPEGKIVARVVEHATDYTVGTPGEAEVVVRDNDDGLNDLPEVTITADRTPITEGETASFTVSVSTPAPEGGLAVDVALSEEGEFTGTLPETRAVTVPAGQRTEGVSVPTIDDGVDEPDGKIVARVVEHATDYAVGTPDEAEVRVKDNDEPAEDEPTVTIIGQVIPRLGRTIAGIVSDAIDCERYFRFPEDHATIGGLEVLPRSHVEEGLVSMDLQDAFSWNRDGHRDENWMSEDAALQNSSFAVTSGDRDDGTSVALWAKGALAGFTGSYKELSLHGNVVSGVAGAEHIRRDRRSGIAVAQSTGVIEYSLPSFGSGTAHASLTSLHPYRCWFASDSTWMWAMLGYGSGIASFSGLADVDRVNTSMRMGALGMTGKLLTQESWELVWKASAFAVSMGIDESRSELPIRGDVFSFRGMFESTWEHEYESGAVLHSSLEAGGRYDGGDAETGGSLALGGGVRYTAPDERGLTAEVNGHGLTQHGDSAFEAWGIDGTLRFSRKMGGRDLSLEIDVGHGSRSDTVRLWLEPDAVAPLRGEALADAGVRVGVRLNRGGLELGRLGSVVHHVGFDSGPHGQSVNTGVSLAPDCCLHFVLEGVYTIEPRRERIARLGLRLRW